MSSAPRNPIVTALPKLAAADSEQVEILSQQEDSMVVRKDDTVFKVHAPETKESTLQAQLCAANSAEVRQVLLPPRTTAVYQVEDRLVSCWPYAKPLSQDDDEAIPWEKAASMLAELHRMVGERIFEVMTGRSPEGATQTQPGAGPWESQQP